MRALVPALREAARGRLPEYMVPAAFVRAGGAARSRPTARWTAGRCPRPERARLARAAYVAPRTPAEERAGGDLGEVLGVERVGGDDNFFELGGHSLLATQVVSRVREALGVELPLRALFEAPDAGRAGAGAWRRCGARRAGAAADRAGGARRAPLPLSFAQQRLWFLDQLEPGERRLQHPRARCGCAGALDAAALGARWTRSCARHEALRTTFARGGRRAGAA